MNIYGEMHQQKLKEILEEIYVMGQETASIQIDEILLEIQEKLITYLEMTHESTRHGVGS